jgi:hypothetical protein
MGTSTELELHVGDELAARSTAGLQSSVPIIATPC